MKLAQHDINNIIRKIKEDLYKVEEERIQQQKVDITKRIRTFYMDKYQAIIDQLPPELVSHSKRFSIDVNYNPTQSSDPKSEDIVDETWNYDSPTKVPNPMDHGANTYYGEDVSKQKIPINFQAEAAQICNDTIELRKERNEMSEYLEQTTNQYTGTKQLRKVWPESLHRFLPPEKPKAPRKVTPKSIPKRLKPKPVQAPEVLNKRLTTNLLEKE